MAHSNVKRLVIKVGTRLLSDSRYRLDKRRLAVVAGHVLEARARGIATVLVTSGAVGAGMGALGKSRRPSAMVEKQACAAVGQSLLMHEYGRIFSKAGVTTAQVLVTRSDMSDRERHQNVRRALDQLLENEILPIVNENDVVATEELHFGDNDMLSGLVADLLGAEMLAILTDVDGLYYGEGPRRAVLSTVSEITPEIVALARGPEKGASVGGMVTKIETAGRMARAGRVTVIANGRDRTAIRRILDGEEFGTVFLPSGRKLAARKRWIADYLRPSGRVVVDWGAANALRKRGSSLLPSGVRSVEGAFERGAAVVIVDEAAETVAHGLAAYSASEIDRIRGLRSGDIAKKLGYSCGEEIVHRDDLVLA